MSAVAIAGIELICANDHLQWDMCSRRVDEAWHQFMAVLPRVHPVLHVLVATLVERQILRVAP